MAAWTFIGRDPPNAIHDRWSTYSSPAPLDCAVEGITFSPLDLPRYDSLPGYRAEAFWSLWDPLGKHANVYGEVNLILHLIHPVDMHVGIPRGLNVGRPETRLQLEYAQAGDMSQASRHPLVPRAFPWPASLALPFLRSLLTSSTINRSISLSFPAMTLYLFLNLVMRS